MKIKKPKQGGWLDRNWFGIALVGIFVVGCLVIGFKNGWGSFGDGGCGK